MLGASSKPTQRAARRPLAAVAVLTAIVALGPAIATLPRMHDRGGSTARVIVQGRRGSGSDIERLVRRLGGSVAFRLPVIDGAAAVMPRGALDALAQASDVRAVTPDTSVSFHSVDPTLGYDPSADLGSLYDITKIIGAQDSWKAGYTGKGIDIALIDTGVAPVPGLTSGNVVYGPDLSFDSQDPALTDNDGFGHGTHMASLIVGRDQAGTPSSYLSPTTFSGVAPDARLVSVKVGAMDGATDVSQVIAAIDWVVQHATAPGFNIRVLSLSFGTDGVQGSSLDPLAYAAEVAWRSGIVVVVSGGNDGNATKLLADPARDPVLLAVGASDPVGTLDPADDIVPAFATRGQADRHVDLVAPGVHVLGLRSPGSYIDESHPSARVGARFFRGSGTSQAAAITAGAVALFLQRYPMATPDQAKKMLMSRAIPLKNVSSLYRGNGSVEVRRAQVAMLNPKTTQPASLFGTGRGSLEGARGSAHVVADGVQLVGERDIFGEPWNAAVWSTSALTRSSWSGGVWNGSVWTGEGWTSSYWGGTAWTNAVWTGRTWTGRTWTGRTWTGRTWTGVAWEGDAWAGGFWAGRTWTNSTWATGEWR